MTFAEDLEYRIRKLQRGIGVASKTNRLLEGEAAHAFLVHSRATIQRYAQEIIELKQLLFSMTGRHSPRSPKWPL